MAIRHATGSPPRKPNRIKKAFAATVATALISIGLVSATALVAEAHTLSVTTSCEALTVDLQSYRYQPAVPAQGYTENEWTKTITDTKTSIDSPGDGWVKGDAVAWEYVDKHGNTRWEDSATWNAQSNPESFGWKLSGRVKYQWTKTTVETQWSKDSPGTGWIKTGQSRFHETSPAQPEKTNSVVVTIDNTQVTNTTFETSFTHVYDYKNYGGTSVGHTYSVVVTAWDDPTGSHGWTKPFTGASTACQQPVIEDASAAIVTNPATCTADGVPSVGAILNATWGTPVINGSTWSATATANKGHAFPGGALTKVFNESIVPKLPGQSTNPSGQCYVPPTIQQCTTISNGPVSTNLNPAGWDFSESRTSGFHEYVDGGLHVWTTASDSGNAQSKSAGYIAVTPFPLALVGTPSIEFASHSGVRPSLQLGIDRDGNGTWDGYLVYEPWAYGDGNWWTNKAGFGVPAGMGYPSFGTLQQFLAANPNAKVVSLGYSLGSGVIGDAVITKITVGCTTYTFNHVTPPPTKVTVPTPTVVDKCDTYQDSVTGVPTPGVRYEYDGWFNEDGTFTFVMYSYPTLINGVMSTLNTEGVPTQDKLPANYVGFYINGDGVLTYTVVTQNQPCSPQPPDTVVVTEGTPVCGVDTVPVVTTTTSHVWNSSTSNWDTVAPKSVKSTRPLTDKEKAALNCPTTSPSPTPSTSTSPPATTPSATPVAAPVVKPSTAPTQKPAASLASTGSNVSAYAWVIAGLFVVGGAFLALAGFDRRRRHNQA